MAHLGKPAPGILNFWSNTVLCSRHSLLISRVSSERGTLASHKRRACHGPLWSAMFATLIRLNVVDCATNPHRMVEDRLAEIIHERSRRSLPYCGERKPPTNLMLFTTTPKLHTESIRNARSSARPNPNTSHSRTDNSGALRAPKVKRAAVRFC